MTAVWQWQSEDTPARCILCEALDGIQVPIGGRFPLGKVPPIHLHCVCEVVTVDDGSDYELYELNTRGDAQGVPMSKSPTTSLRTDASRGSLRAPVQLTADETAELERAMARGDRAAVDSIKERARKRASTAKHDCACGDLQATAERTYVHGDALAPADRAALVGELKRLDGIQVSPTDHDVFVAGIYLGAIRRAARTDGTSRGRDHEDAARQAMKVDTTAAWKRSRV